MSDTPFKIGKKYFIRTVTMHIICEIKETSKKFLVGKKASWIADSGRFHDALKSGALNEVEPFTDDVIIGVGAIVDATEWKHELPREQK